MAVSIHSRPSSVSLSEIIAVNTCNPVGGREQTAECTVKYIDTREVMSRQPSVQWNTRQYGGGREQAAECMVKYTIIQWRSWADSRVYSEIPYGLSIVQKNKAKEKTEAGCWGRDCESLTQDSGKEESSIKKRCKPWENPWNRGQCAKALRSNGTWGI